MKDGGRIYLDKFCSVTSILSQTKPPSEFFALKNWAKSQVSELGKEKFKEKKKSISRRGTLFHHVSTAQIWSEKTANISWCYHWSPREMRSEKLVQKFHTDDISLPRLGECVWLVEANFQPVRSTTQFWVVIHHGMEFLYSLPRCHFTCQRNQC